MKLRPFQLDAIERIVDAYLRGDKQAVVEMTQGSGKTAVAYFSCRKLAELDKSLSIAWISQVKHQLSEIVSQWAGDGDPVKIVFYTPTELVNAIANQSVSPDSFGALFFLDVHPANKSLAEWLDYFPGFKLLITTFNSYTHLPSTPVLYRYGLEEALAEGTLHGIALKSALEKITESINDHHPASEIFAGLKLAEQECSDLVNTLEVFRNGKIKIADILNMQNKRTALERFHRLLYDNDYFDKQVENDASPEGIWQSFFENNQWIFGFGLNYIFNTSLHGGKLEQTVAGHSISAAGKRVDALLHSNGLISSLCFAEIKTHRKSLIRGKTPYRPDTWSISDELAGGIAQLQRTVQVSLENLKNHLTLKDEHGFNEGKLYLYKPRSFLIIGSLSEFTNQGGDVHEAKYSSFQMFRNSFSDIEVITFDELYQRAEGLVGRATDGGSLL